MAKPIRHYVQLIPIGILFWFQIERFKAMDQNQSEYTKPAHCNGKIPDNDETNQEQLHAHLNTVGVSLSPNNVDNFHSR